MTLTAPSFGRVHRVPRSGSSRRCRCGVRHSWLDADLRGVPLDPELYDYAGQVVWNRDSGVLWDRTRRRLRDRWSSAEFFIVREWQDRGVLHLHVLVRIHRSEPSTREAIREAARTAVAISPVDGTQAEWGEQVDVQRFRASGDGARTIWYLSKALNYVMKDAAREALAGHGRRSDSRVWRHLIALEAAARSVRCSRGCVPGQCRSRSHERYGARSHVVSATRRTKSRSGWSFTGLTRALQRRRRAEWMQRQQEQTGDPQPARVAHVPVAGSSWHRAVPWSGAVP